MDHLNIPQIHVLNAAEAFGIPATRVDTLDQLTDFVAQSPAATGPRLVETLEK